MRHDVAMTGEISLRGQVLPVGGIREKALAAFRAGIKHVILPSGNESDLADVPREVRGKMRFHLVDEVAEVFRIALGKAPKSVQTKAVRSRHRRTDKDGQRKPAKGRRSQ